MTTLIEPIKPIFGTHVTPKHVQVYNIYGITENGIRPTRRRQQTPDKANKASQHRINVRQTQIFLNHIPLPGGDLLLSAINSKISLQRFSSHDVFLEPFIFCDRLRLSTAYRSAATGHTVSVFARFTCFHCQRLPVPTPDIRCTTAVGKSSPTIGDNGLFQCRPR